MVQPRQDRLSRAGSGGVQNSQCPRINLQIRHSGVCMANRNRLSPATFIDANRWRVTPQDVARRFAERDQRIAPDTRTEAQKYLGDPPPDRSALAQRTRAAGS